MRVNGFKKLNDFMKTGLARALRYPQERSVTGL